MGLHDRGYWREPPDERSGSQGRGMLGALTIGMPKPGRMVQALLILNIVVFIAQAVGDQSPGGAQVGWMSATFGAKVSAWWQLWRYVTFQFLHGGFLHIALNMLALYMLGTPLEQRWGGKRFLRFYLSCGAVAGICYVCVMAAVHGLHSTVPIIGASGGVFAIVLACAVLFPHFRLIFFLFPVPIRFAALIIFGGMGILILQSIRAGVYTGEFWSHVAHLGGAVTAAVWIWVIPRLRGTLNEARDRASRGAWERKMKQRAEEEREIDRILDKIQQYGLDSLSRREKRTLQDATRRQRNEERKQYRC